MSIRKIVKGILLAFCAAVVLYFGIACVLDGGNEYTIMYESSPTEMSYEIICKDVRFMDLIFDEQDILSNTDETMTLYKESSFLDLDFCIALKITQSPDSLEARWYFGELRGLEF